MKPEYVQLSAISPAAYNPRRIDGDSFKRLCESVSRLGIIIPVIVNSENGTIIAGHQRTKAAQAVGLETVPVFWAEGVNLADEILFNQIHNGTDFDAGETAFIEPLGFAGWGECPAERNHGGCKRGGVVTEVCKLIERYGNVLSCVVTGDGEVVKCPAYATACKLLGIPANVYVLERGQEDAAKQALDGDFGEFCYDGLEKHTWVQGRAQMERRREKVSRSGSAAKRTCKSRTYEELVIPSVSKADRVLDFGAGKGVYVDLLKAEGYDIRGVEFYPQNLHGINVAKAERMAAALLDDVRERGLFDVVVLDSVLNSVDSLEAEASVMATCNALLKPGGRLFFSGRRRENAEHLNGARRNANGDNNMFFMDSDGFTARFRNGNFFYQKFHTEGQVMALAKRHGFRVGDHRVSSAAWRASAVKQRQDPEWERGVRFEFSLPHPQGRYDFADDAVEAISSWT